MDSSGHQDRQSRADAARSLADRRQTERLLRNKSRLQSELDVVCKKLEVDRMRLRDFDYAIQPSQNAEHGWNFNTRLSFASRIVLTSHSLREECSRLQEKKDNLIQQIQCVDQQINSLRP